MRSSNPREAQLAAPLPRAVDFGPQICRNLPEAESREWLVTNELGGYAAGTVSGILTRNYHGLLIAALNPPVERRLLAAKLDETAEYDGRVYRLSADRWADQQVEPRGYQYLERFQLVGTTPVWRFELADARLEKRIWMRPGENTTYVRYEYVEGRGPLALVLDVRLNHRDHHAVTHTDGGWAKIDPVDNGLQITFENWQPYFVFCQRVQVLPQHKWVGDYFYAVEDYRGLSCVDRHLLAGTLAASLNPGENLTVIFSTQPKPNLDAEAALDARQTYEAGLLSQSGWTAAPAWVQQLVLAADQFIVQRAVPGDPDGRSILAGFPWFSDWGRDTMIALSGLTLSTRRFDVAEKILRTFATHVSQGMLPNRFPDEGGQAEYNTVDATLWYFEALRAYYAATGDEQLIRDLFPTLRNIIDWHQKGTRYQIHMDPTDGLIYAGEPGVQLTWMDVKIDDWVVTPRIGKPVEINALWYNALRAMADFAEIVPQPADVYRELAGRVEISFSRFWNGKTDFCFDVIDGPAGDDPALRPNQLFAVSLPHSPLTLEQQRAVVDACERALHAPCGLRSLAPDHPDFIGTYGGDQRQRDAAYHQGTVWGWLMGPFVTAHLKAYGDPQRAREFLAPFEGHICEHGLGTVSEVFEGDPPHTPRACFAQAWSVAEVLRTWEQIYKAES